MPSYDYYMVCMQEIRTSVHAIFYHRECLVILNEVKLIKNEIVLQFMLARACDNANYTLLLDHDADMLPVILVTIGSDINEGRVEVCSLNFLFS